MDLDFFVMFSSMASVVGNNGQSSYSACNAFQDALAQYRRLVLGLPGLAINWGPISGAGVMERKTGIAKLMVFAGLGFINAKEGKLDVFKELTTKGSQEFDQSFQLHFFLLVLLNHSAKKLSNSDSQSQSMKFCNKSRSVFNPKNLV